MQTARHVQRALFRCLRQQDYKLIPAITEREIDQPAMLLQRISDLRQQPGAHQVPVRIVYLLEMVQVDENDREFVVVALRTVDLRLQDEAHVPRVIERSAVVGDGQLVNFLDVPGVLQGDGRKVRKRLEQLQVPRIESLRTDAIDELDHSQASVAKPHRHRDDRLRLGLGLLVDLREKPRVLGRIRDHYGLAVLRHPARNSLPHLDPYVLQRLGGFPHRQLKVQFLFGLIQQQQRPIVRAQKFIDLLHNRAENLIELQRGRQRLPQLLEDGNLSLFPLFGRHRRIAAAFDGRKLVYFLHSRFFLSLAILRLAMPAPGPGRRIIAEKHKPDRFSRTVGNLRQYRPLRKNHATRSWYRRGYLAILALALVMPTFRPAFARGWRHGRSQLLGRIPCRCRSTGAFQGVHYTPCPASARLGRDVHS